MWTIGKFQATFLTDWYQGWYPLSSSIAWVMAWTAPSAGWHQFGWGTVDTLETRAAVRGASAGWKSKSTRTSQNVTEKCKGFYLRRINSMEENRLRTNWQGSSSARKGSDNKLNRSKQCALQRLTIHWLCCQDSSKKAEGRGIPLCMALLWFHLEYYAHLVGTLQYEISASW